MRNPVSFLVTSSLLLGLLCAPVYAAKTEGPKAKLMAKYDKNGNGVIDGDEIAAVRADFAAAPGGDLKRFDKNKDGKLGDAEIAEMKAPGGKIKRNGERKNSSSDTKSSSDKSEKSQ